MNKFAAMGVVSLILTTFSAPVNAEAKTPNVTTQSVVYGPSSKITKSQIKAINDLKLITNAAEIKKTVKQLKKYVGKTWYVFSGNTPSGWDCSGLTMWFYEQLGVTLEHRATKQESAGKLTKDPIIGDIVVFKYKGYKSAYHVGIYIGNGLMIHAPKRGHLTAVQNIADFAGNYSKVEYVRVIDSLGLDVATQYPTVS